MPLLHPDRIDMRPVVSRASQAAADAQLAWVVRHPAFARLEPHHDGGYRLTIRNARGEEGSLVAGLDVAVAQVAELLRRRDAGAK